MWLYPPHQDDVTRLVFKGHRGDNPIEFVKSCERELERVGSQLTDPEKIEFTSRHFKESAARWFTIVRDTITTYDQFKECFENRYWNVHTQRRVRDQLEYGRYPIGGKLSMDEYVIQQVERSKHLKPQFTEHELVWKLSYHFSREIRTAVYIQGIKTVDELLILVSQSENLYRPEKSYNVNVANKQTENEREKGGGSNQQEKAKQTQGFKPSHPTTNIGNTAEKRKGGYSWPNTGKKFPRPYERDINAVTIQQEVRGRETDAQPSSSKQNA